MQETTVTPTWTDGLGRKAGTVYFDRFGRRRVVTAPEFYDDDDNLVATGYEAVEAFSAHIDAQQIARQHVARKMAANRSPSARGRTRARGAGRPAVKGSSRRSSERSGDSGSEDGESEPPPRRLCAFCGGDIPAGRSPLAKHCKDQHADRDRQRRKRQRDRERDLRPRIPTTADLLRMYRFDDGELERLRDLAVCGCNGRHLELDPGECFWCGRWLPNGMAA